MAKKKKNIFERTYPRFWRDFIYTKVAGSILVPRPYRWRLLRALGMDVQQSIIAPGSYFSDRRIHIAKNVGINTGAFFDASDDIWIEEDVYMGMGVSIITSTHEIGPSRKRLGPGATAPVRIGRGTWIAGNVTILPGVTIGAGCVIAAGSVVNKNLKPDGLYAGMPARRIKDLEPGEDRDDAVNVAGDAALAQ
ncbi:MAG: hypothetical protein JWP66_1893 [Naasia sp.]|nr:hypothetical protein [Naasia sp.]